MDFKAFAKKYAQEINGDFSEYDDHQSVIVIQLPDERFQAVQGSIVHSPQYGREVLHLKSTVCKESEKINFPNLLSESKENVHTRFVVDDGYLKVEALAFMDSLTEARIKEMIQEVGNVADQWEFKITGKDIY